MCRCQADSNEDEILHGHIADAVVWNKALDFLSLRMALHRGLAAAHSLLQNLDSTTDIIFATPADGCPFR
jgi:hypothetical protein